MKTAPPQEVEGIYRMPCPLNSDKRRLHTKSTLNPEEPKRLRDDISALREKDFSPCAPNN